MSATNATFTFGDKSLHYIQYGAGRKVLLTFTGFGQTQEAYDSFARAFGKDYTVFSFDLPFHGKSFWKASEEPLLKTEWKNLLGAFLTEHGVDKFSVAGFSLGGKLALATLEMFPQKVEHLLLLAPDGIKINFWYNLATYSPFLRRYFKSLILRPKSFFYVLSLIRNFHIVDKGVLKLASNQMSTVKKRRRVYYTWVVLRKLVFDQATLAGLINKYKVSVTFYLGEFDKVITKKNIQAFLTLLDHYELHELKSGHFTLIENVAKYIQNFDRNSKNL